MTTYKIKALTFLYNNCQLSYEELLDKVTSSTINVTRLRFLYVEIYKTVNNLNPSFMKQIFELRETHRSVREKYLLNLKIPNYNQVTFSKKSLEIVEPKIWNSLSYHIKSSSVWFVKSYKPYFYLFHLSFVPYSNTYSLNVCVVGFD